MRPKLSRFALFLGPLFCSLEARSAPIDDYDDAGHVVEGVPQVEDVQQGLDALDLCRVDA